MILYKEGIGGEMKIIAIVVAGVVGLSVLVAAYVRGVELRGRSSIDRVLADPLVAKVRFGDSTYAVPRRYLIGVSQPTSTSTYASIYIQMALPPQIAGQSSQVDQRGWGIGSREIYFKATSKGSLFFTCDDKEEFPAIKYPSCTVNEYMGDNRGVIYHFSKNYMDRTSEIDSWLRNLMRSFLVK